MGFDFSQTKNIRLKAKTLNHVTLGKKTWDKHIIKDRGRDHIKHNEKLLKETLQKPDTIRQDKQDPNILKFYKKTHGYHITPTIKISTKEFRYFVIVIQKNHKYIITMYTSPKIKGGNQIWPPKT